MLYYTNLSSPVKVYPKHSSVVSQRAHHGDPAAVRPGALRAVSEHPSKSQYTWHVLSTPPFKSGVHCVVQQEETRKRCHDDALMSTRTLGVPRGTFLQQPELAPFSELPRRKLWRHPSGGRMAWYLEDVAGYAKPSSVGYFTSSHIIEQFLLEKNEEYLFGDDCTAWVNILNAH